MVEDVVIVGAGGHAKEIAYLIEEINRYKKTWNLLGFIERDNSNKDAYNGNYQVIGDENYLVNSKIKNAVIAIGTPNIVQKIHQRISNLNTNLKFPNIIHPDISKKMSRNQIGAGNIICEGNIFTTDISIGSFNCFNRACNISHDCVIEDYCIINPGVNISGGVKLRSNCLIGTGATILQYLEIGKGATVGAGSLAARDVEAGTTVVGVPARVARKKENA